MKFHLGKWTHKLEVVRKGAVGIRCVPVVSLCQWSFGICLVLSCTLLASHSDLGAVGVRGTYNVSSVDVTEAVRICCGGAFSRNVCEANLSHTQAISAVEASGRGYEIIMLLGTFLCVPARRTPSVWMCLVVTYGDNIS
jgi:hypothetical protein